MLQSESKPTDRLGGREKAPLLIKVRIEGSTAAGLMVSKPRNMPMSTFCATLIEYGLGQWEAAQKIRDQVIEQTASTVSQKLEELEQAEKSKESEELNQAEESEG